MTTPTITELYDQLGTMMGSWQRFLDQQMVWQAGPNADNDVSPPNGDTALRGYRVMQDATGNEKNVMTPAQLEKIAKDAVKLITDLKPTELASNLSSLSNDANAIATTLNSARSELTALKDQTVSAKDAAKQSESSAATSANSAAVSSSNASNSATAAASSASSALASKDSAAGSASTATQKANDAGASAAKAQSWASAALDVQVETGKYSALHYASKAAGSASTASTKAAEAASSVTKSQNWATGAVDFQVESGKYSALHHATKAAASAASAQSSASTATTKASEAANSASTAATAATTSTTNASEASTAASTATTKASEAAASATLAGTKATAASNSATDSAGSATAAANSATAAANSATAAANSATAAANSATAAANSATQSASSASMAEKYMLEAKNAMYVSTGALVEAGDVSMASGSYPSPLLDAKGNKLATFWKVTAAGVSIDGVDYQVGDTLVYSVATNSYYKIDNTESVTSVNGKKGAVTLTHADVGALAATATAVAATKLATARSVSLTGGATGTGSFDGTANLSIAVTVGDDTHKHTFANLKSLPTTLAGYGITDAASLSHGHSDLLSKAGGAMSGAMTIDIASNPTIAGANFANGWLQVGTSSMGIAIDPNEIFNVGTDLIIGTLTAGTGIKFKPGGGTGSAAGEVKDDGLYSAGSKVLTAASGNAVSASKLAAAASITIGSTTKTFDGSEPLSFSVSEIGALADSANAVSASKWETARTISLSGAATGSSTIDGSANVSIAVTVPPTGHVHALREISDSPYKESVDAATVAALTVTATSTTLTNAGTQAAIVIDGVTLAAGMRLLVKDQASPAQNGIYVVTNIGSASTNWVLTRSPDADTVAKIAGAVVTVGYGTVNGAGFFTNSFKKWSTIGTTAMNWRSVVDRGNISSLHHPSGATAGTYSSVTINSQGHVTSGSNPTTLAGYGITDAVSSSGGEMLGSLTLGANELIFKGDVDTGDIVFANADGSQKSRVWYSDSGLTFSSTTSTSPTAAGSMQLTSAGLTVGGNLVYHADNKPTAADVGAVSKVGDTMTGPLTINVDSASTRFLSAVNETDGWTLMQMGKSAVANQGHFAWNTQSYDGHPANAFHFRPTGGQTVMSAAKGVVTICNDAVLDFQDNSTWGGKLRVGGNGRTASNDGVTASVTTTNGNLHLDAASGDRAVYLSYYAGSSGVKFGNGAGSIVGSVDNAGNMSMNGTITAPQFNGYLNGTAAVASYLNSGASSTGVTSITSRVNSGFYECSATTTANGWPLSGSWYHMMASTNSNGSSYYSMQFAADFYNSNNLFFRCTNGNGATGWNRVWHGGNFNPNTKANASITINGKPLTGNITLTASDVGAATSTIGMVQLSAQMTLGPDSKPVVGSMCEVYRNVPPYQTASAVTYGSTVAGSAIQSYATTGMLTGTWRILSSWSALPDSNSSSVTQSAIGIRIA